MENTPITTHSSNTKSSPSLHLTSHIYPIQLPNYSIPRDNSPSLTVHETSHYFNPMHTPSEEGRRNTLQIPSSVNHSKIILLHPDSWILARKECISVLHTTTSPSMLKDRNRPLDSVPDLATLNNTLWLVICTFISAQNGFTPFTHDPGISIIQVNVPSWWLHSCRMTSTITHHSPIFTPTALSHHLLLP